VVLSVLGSQLSPASAIKDERADLVVLRAHGHGFLADRFLGHTIDTLRHALEIPVLVVRDAD
jgi:manganese transport protein